MLCGYVYTSQIVLAHVYHHLQSKAVGLARRAFFISIINVQATCDTEAGISATLERLHNVNGMCKAYRLNGYSGEYAALPDTMSDAISDTTSEINWQTMAILLTQSCYEIQISLISMHAVVVARQLSNLLVLTKKRLYICTISVVLSQREAAVAQNGHVLTCSLAHVLPLLTSSNIDKI